jgi:hypothetical protein
MPMSTDFPPRINSPRFWLLILLALAGSLLLSTTLPAAAAVGEPVAAPEQAAGQLFVPAEYGEIVYQKNGDGPRQIYIIGQSHRSALSGQDAPDTIRVQAEIYRLGEWLIQEQNVELLLPEGFFQKAPTAISVPGERLRQGVRLDNQRLHAELSDRSRFVNADLLLNTSYNIPLGQVEDEQLYLRINRLLREADGQNRLALLAALDDLQNERTAVMLENIPGVVEEAFGNGSIGSRKAMVTIGLAHVHEIISLLQRDLAPSPAARAGLNLLDQGYGVTVIIPRTLAENQRIMRLCKLANGRRGATPLHPVVAEAQPQVIAER